MESGQSSAGSRVGSPEADSMNPGLPCWWFGRSQSVGCELVQLNTRCGLKGHTVFIGTGLARDGGNIPGWQWRASGPLPGNGWYAV